MKLFIHSQTLGMDKQSHPTLYNISSYFSLLGFDLNLWSLVSDERIDRLVDTHLYNPQTPIMQNVKFKMLY